MAIDINGSGTITGISVGGLNDGCIAANDLASTAITDKLGYTPANIQAENIGFRNRIINGDMRIDQRNAGASVTNSSSILVFPVDRNFIYGTISSKFTGQQNAGSVTPPTGFVNYLGATSSSAYTVGAGEFFVISQYIEGTNIADLMWGTANAKTVTLSFWVYSSLTGTFGGALQNNGLNRSYAFTYTISAANTWEYKTVTIAGDTSGTWLTTNGIGIRIWIGLGVGSTFNTTAGSWAGADYRGATGATSVVGTNGATFYITGFQFEVGSVATPFERRPYGTELQLCQRYYEQANMAVYSTVTRNSYSYHVPKRAYPSSVTLTTGTIINYYEDFASFSNGADAATTMKINAEL